MSPTQRVTCVVTAYNYAQYLPEALESALGQTHPNVEVLVVDDGSTDDTPAVLARYGDRIRVVRQENSGLNAATARGILEARGDLIALLDADDVWHADKLERQVALLEARPELGLVFSDVEIVDGAGLPVAPSHFGRHGLTPARGADALGMLLQENTVPAPTIVFRRSLASHVLPVAEEASFQDWWLGLRIAEVAEIDLVDAPLVRYRVHGDNMTGAGFDKWLANMRKDNRFRRWMLGHLDLSGVSGEHLRSAWLRFEHHTAVVGAQAGHDGTAEVELQGRNPHRAAQLLAAGNPLGALAADPLHAAARAAFLASTATPGERIAAAEQRFLAGDAAGAVALLDEVAAGASDHDAALALSNLAVIAATRGEHDLARSHARAALLHDPSRIEASEVLDRLPAPSPTLEPIS